MLRAIIDQIILTWRLLRDPRVSSWAKIIPIVGVLYVLSPLDFIPDFRIGIGQLDDLGVIFAALRVFEAIVPSYITAEHRAAIGRRQKPVEIVDAPSYRVLHPEDEKKEV